MLKYVLAQFLSSLVLLWLFKSYTSAFNITDNHVLFVVAGVWALVNITIKPILKLLLLPLRVVTLGLFTLIINLAIFTFVIRLIDGVDCSSWLILVAIVISNSLLSIIINKIL